MGHPVVEGDLSMRRHCFPRREVYVDHWLSLGVWNNGFTAASFASLDDRKTRKCQAK